MSTLVTGISSWQVLAPTIYLGRRGVYNNSNNNNNNWLMAKVHP